MNSDEGQTTQTLPARVVAEPPQALTGQSQGAAARPVATTVLQSSDEVNGIIEALCKAQAQFGAVTKDRVADVQSRSGASFKYGYATLAAVIAAVRPALNAQGIALVQSANVVNGERAVLLQVDTRFLHTSGQWLGSVLRLPLGDVTPQGMGSLLTYLRRYGLSALAGVASEEDDDAQSVQPPSVVRPKPDRRETPRPATPPPAAPPPLENELPPPAGKAPKAARAATATAPATAATAAPKAPAVPLGGPESITNRDRALLFKTAKTAAWSEADVKSLIKQMFNHDSTSQLTQTEFRTVLGSIEHPEDFGVTFETLEGTRVVVVGPAVRQ
jgi:hypothetical protein